MVTSGGGTFIIRLIFARLIEKNNSHIVDMSDVCGDNPDMELMVKHPPLQAAIALYVKAKWKWKELGTSYCRSNFLISRDLFPQLHGSNYSLKMKNLPQSVQDVLVKSMENTPYALWELFDDSMYPRNTTPSWTRR